MTTTGDATAQLDLSVIIPVYRREASVGATIASVAPASGAFYEILVVDDGSPDGSARAAQTAIDAHHAHRGRVIRQANGGPGAARNTGARAARGRYLAFLDSDDYWFPQTLAATLAALDEAPALIFLQTIDVTEGSELPRQDPPAPLRHRFDGFLEAVTGYPGTRYGSCNVVVRRAVFEALGGFTEDVRCSEDTDLFLRAAAMGPCHILAGAPLVAHVAGAADRLTGNFASVRAGYEFMDARERAQGYPDSASGPALKDRVLAQCAAHTVLAAFASGHVRAAYGLYLRGLPRLVRGRNWHWALRLPLLPLLALLRPSSFAVRWSSRAP